MAVVILINDVTYELPNQYKDYKDLFDCEEFKNFQNQKRQEKYEKNKVDILQNVLKNGGLFFGASGQGHSMIDYIPEFISYLNKKRRKEKIDKLLNL